MTSKPRRTSGAKPPGLVWDRHGLRLADGSLAFDGSGEGGATFLGHALVGALRGRARIITSDLTARLLGARLGPALATPFRRSFSLGPLELELLPSGYVPGAAALVVRGGGRVLLYAGEVGQGATLCGLPPAAPLRCDHLVIRSGTGESLAPLPPAVETLVRIVEFAGRTRRAGEITLLHGSPLGPLPAVIGPLQAAGIPVRAHRQVHRFLAPLRSAGVPLGPVPRFEGEPEPGEVILWPVEASVRFGGRRVPRARRALLSGRPLTPAALAEAGCTEGFPLGSEMDFPALEAYVTACRPGRVSLLGARCGELERVLAGRGVPVEVLGLPDQLSLFGAEPRGADSPGS